MTFTDFYDALDNELNEVIADNPQDVRLHKGDDSTRKSFAFLIWFLKFYGKRPIYNLNITEGDDDTSCDIIFSTFDNIGKKIVYVIQAKWKSKKNCTEKLDSTAFKATLDDFKLVYSGQKQFSSKNENFNRQYEELKQHLAANEYVKFVYLTLCQTNPSVSENVEQFKKQNADLEIIDIERLRRDFIEMRYKQIQPQNPLEYDYNPENEVITLAIEQLDIEKNFLQVDAPFLSYTFLVRPKTIHDLFEKYGFKLFFWNIRNPLIASSYNHQIEQSLKDSSSFFWYYNNGITAITQRLPKRINTTAKQIEITALQIINGAQTVYSIYQAYKNARNGEKNAINDNALISFRLIQGIGNRDFELDVTRYNNQQNPTEPRDFWANDPVQARLQNESFATNYWYSIRRGEFRVVPPNVRVVSSEDFIKAYIEFWNDEMYVVDSVLLLHDNIWISNEHRNISWTDRKGFYEDFFNEKSKFEDFLIAYQIKEIYNSLFSSSHINNISTTKSLDITALKDVKRVLENIFEDNWRSITLYRIAKNNIEFFYCVFAFIFTNNINFILNPISEEDIQQIDWKKTFSD